MESAVQFTLRLDLDIQYIWIDSLCIVQGDSDDWLRESALMEKVYRNSFLNISATSAETSDDGLYTERNPQRLWQDVISLDINGLQKVTSNGLQDQSYLDPSYTGPIQWANEISCLLMDVTTWETLVNQAPVNRRGWVIQERLLAPRVLHFCHGRIAWECAEFDDIEGHFPDLPKYQLIADEIYEGIPIKRLEPGNNGKELGTIRLRDEDDPLLGNTGNTPTFIRALELWARIVETYSRTDLTRDTDKLIALSGLANRIATLTGRSQEIKYVAGLWDWGQHLVSQLLWHVEPTYSDTLQSGASTLESLAKRPTAYRAPSFSWASVDAQYGKGITCGDILDPEEVLVKIPPDDGLGAECWRRSVFVHSKTENRFGLVMGAHIRLWAYLFPVKLQREETHYYWTLEADNDADDEATMEKHFNVCLDCPGDDDQHDRLTKSQQNDIYCMPVAPPRDSTDLICLLLERVPDDPQVEDWPSDCQERTFRRIGLSKLTLAFDQYALFYIAHQFEKPTGGDDEYDLLKIVYII